MHTNDSYKMPNFTVVWMEFGVPVTRSACAPRSKNIRTSEALIWLCVYASYTYTLASCSHTLAPASRKRARPIQIVYLRILHVHSNTQREHTSCLHVLDITEACTFIMYVYGCSVMLRNAMCSVYFQVTAIALCTSVQRKNAYECASRKTMRQKGQG